MNYIRIFATANVILVIEPWCNGNTADFGSVILSSSLGGSTAFGGVFAKTLPNLFLQWRNTPLGDAPIKNFRYEDDKSHRHIVGGFPIFSLFIPD